MNETQLDRPAAWRKAHRRRLALAGLGEREQHLLLVLDMLGVRDPAHLVRGRPVPDVGWATREDGRPLSRRELVGILRLPLGAAGLADLEAAVGGLVELGHAVVADDGAVGALGWADLQETPDARRMREQRANRAPTNADAPATPVEQIRAVAEQSPNSSDRGQTSEDRGQNFESDDPPAGARGSAPPPPQTLGQRIQATRVLVGLTIRTLAQRATTRDAPIGDALIRRIEADEAQPTRRELEALARVLGDPDLAAHPLAEPSAGVVELVLAAHHEARAALGAEEPRPKVDGEAIREVMAPEPWLPVGLSLVEAWRIVIRRAAEEARRNAEDGRGSRDLEFMTLRHLGGDQRWRRYLAATDLDRRREPRQRGSPGGHVVARAGRKYTSGGKL